MSNIPRFLISRNPLAEPGVDFITHTQTPVMICRVDGQDIVSVWLEPTDMTADKLAGLMRRMGDWYVNLKSHEKKGG